MASNLITIVVGARPNFIKIAPILRAMDRVSDILKYRLVHTGQHHDEEMNGIFYRELDIPEPDVFLNGAGGTHAEQTASIMIDFEVDCRIHCPDIVLVVGDVNSTLACSIAAKKLQITLAHVEAGLRSGDRTMPEEINRLVTDSISDLFFVTEPAGVENLLREGHHASDIHLVGNVMIDNLLYQQDKLSHIDTSKFATEKLKASLTRYGVITLHRPSNVDHSETLGRLVNAINQIAVTLPLIFTIHPRTKYSLEIFGMTFGPNVHLTPPLSYMEFLNLWKDAAVVLTDSGGLQEETTALGVPCVTLRNNSERPITIELGSNRLAGTDPARILREVRNSLCQGNIQPRRPDLWDGDAADRIVKILC